MQRHFYINIIVITIFVFFTEVVEAQSRKDLEAQRQELLQDIQNNNRLLGETKKDKAQAVDRLINLQNQISNREKLIENLKEEINFISDNIERSGEVTESLGNDIEQLKGEYAALVRKAYRLRMNHNPMLLILSAKDLSQAFKRWQYLKEYERFRKRQAKLIVDTQKMLSKKITSLEQKRADKEAILSTIEDQKTHLGKEKQEKQNLVTVLKKDEKRIQSQLKAQQKQHEQLNRSIENVIIAEMNARKREARKPPKSTAPSVANPKPMNKEQEAESNIDEDINETAESSAMSGSFMGAKGKLQMPIDNGIITKRFGKQPHPTLKKIEIVNNGIDIRSDGNSAVKCVFDGKVVGVTFIPGFNNTVIVQHGRYYTVYSNLSSVNYRKGDEINARSIIGTLSNSGDLHFELWKDKQRLNPTQWLKR